MWRMIHTGRTLTVLLLVVATSLIAQAQTFDRLEPYFAQAGDTVTLFGQGFEINLEYTVTIGGTDAPVTDLQPDSISFTVPSAASSGNVVVTVEEFDIPHLGGLSVVREISVDIDTSIDLTGYTIGTIYRESAWSDTGNTTLIAKGKPTLIGASRDDTDPPFIGYTTDSTVSFTLSAQTAATAMGFGSSIVFAADSDDADARMAFIAALPEIQSVATLIEDDISNGRDFVENLQIEALIRDALEQFLASEFVIPPEPKRAKGGLYPAKRGTSADGTVPFLRTPPAGASQAEDFAGALQAFAENSPKDLKLSGLTLLDRLTISTVEAANNADGIPQLGVKFDPAELPFLFGITVKGNPLDWIANVYELDPFQSAFIGGQHSVDVLGLGDAEMFYSRIRTNELHRVSIGASAVTSNLNIVAKLTKEVLARAFGVVDAPPISRLPADRPGLYMIRAFSGANFDPQDTLIAALPGGERERLLMIRVNIMLSVVETADVIGDIFGAFTDSDIASVLFCSSGGVAATLIREDAQGTLDGRLIEVIWNSALKQLFKASVKKYLDNKLKALLGPFEVLTKIATITSKLGAITERINALTNAVNYVIPMAYTAQSVESTIAVIGNPWRPEITSFYPQQGHIGTVVTINGRRFSTTTGENKVEFNSRGTSISAPATVTVATNTRLTVTVPNNALVGEGPIAIQVDSFGKSSTTINDAPFATFKVLADPVLTSVVPNPVRLGGLIKLIGQNFAPRRQNNLVIFANDADHGFSPRNPISVNAEGTEMIVRSSTIFSGDPTDTVRVEVSGRQTDAIPFAIGLGSGGDTGGIRDLRILVSSLADVDILDGDITLREAIMIGNGSRGFTARPEGSDEPFGTFESDFMRGCPEDDDPDTLPTCLIGADYANPITIVAEIQGDTITLTSALPEMGNHDSLSLLGGALFDDITIDGAGLAIDCFRLSGRTQVRVSNVIIENFAGAGVRLSSGSIGNIFSFVTVDSCTNSFVLETGASSNLFEYIQSSNNTSHGVWLKGLGVQYNVFIASLESTVGLRDCTGNGYGVLIEDGAAFNSVSVGDVVGNALGGYRIRGALTIGNHIGASDNEPSPRGRVLDNCGPGVHVDVGPNVIRRLDILGNQGDGILLEGEDCQGVEVSLCRIGYEVLEDPNYEDYEGEGIATARPNLGSGIHVRRGASLITIGAVRAAGGDVPFTYIAGNRDHGIWLEGSLDAPLNVRDIKIRMTSVGITHFRNFSGLSAAPQVVPNGINGIYISSGARDIQIGESDPFLGVSGSGHTEGSGLLIEGPGTTNVRVGNSSFGHPPAITSVPFGEESPYGNKYGIRITGGAQNIVIGIRGEPDPNFEPPYDFFSFDGDAFFPNYMIHFHTSVMGNLEAGIFLDDTGAIIPSVTRPRGSPPPTPLNGNVIQNVRIGGPTLAFDSVGQGTFPFSQGNKIGLLIRGSKTFGNRIGGSQKGEGNIFHFNRVAAIKIEDSDLEAGQANRIIGNTIERTLLDFSTSVDPLGANASGIGIFIENASGHVIGGLGAGEGNILRRNWHGIQVRSSSNIRIENNLIGTDDQSGTLLDDGGNEFSGVIIKDSFAISLGPANQIVRNGFDRYNIDTLLFGGVFITGGSDNKVFGNWIGTDPNEQFLLGNKPNGLKIMDSTDNEIGFIALSDANVIVDSVEDGVVLDGAGVAFNQVGHNYIGVGRPAMQLIGPNGGSGVLITNGASDNAIGGVMNVQIQSSLLPVRAQNYIRRNTLDGIRVNGNTTLRNSIGNNSISDNGGLGINNLFGGNSEIPPPTIVVVTADEVFGTVDEDYVPDGSIVQVFSDNADEGDSFEGEGVVIDGEFNILTGGRNLPEVTATVTHVTTGDTSEFGEAVTIDVALDIRRAIEEPFSILAEPGMTVSVLPLLLTTAEADVIVSSITIAASGTADPAVAIAGVSIYADRDNDGVHGELDSLVAGPITFEAKGTTATFSSMFAGLEGETVTPWLLIVELAPGLPFDQTLILTIENETFVTSAGIFPPVAITETGSFPLVSDTISIVKNASLPVLNVGPLTHDINAAATDIDIDISNTGVGTLDWAATVLTGEDFISIEPPASGMGAATVNLTISENTTDDERVGTVEISASGAIDSPATVTITQAGANTPVLGVTPASRDFDAAATDTTFNVTNEGGGTLNWTAMIIDGDFLTITAGDSGENDGVIEVAIAENTTGSAREGTIRVADPAAFGSPIDVTVSQIDCILPGLVNGVIASDGTLSDRVQINWNAATNALEYDVLRSATDEPETASVIGTVSTTTFDDLTATPPEEPDGMGCSTTPTFFTFFYWVRAVNDCGTSELSTTDAGFVGEADPEAKSVFETVMPSRRNDEGIQLAAIDSTLAIRIRSEDAIDIATAWGRIVSAQLDTGDIGWLALDLNDGWVVYEPKVDWTHGTTLIMVAGATTTEGEPIGPFTYEFLVENTAEDSAIKEDDVLQVYEAQNTSGFPALADGVGLVYQIGNDQAYDLPHWAWLPVPEGEEADTVYYLFGESQWHDAHFVEGFLESDDILTTQIDSRSYIGIQVNHGGTVRLGTATQQTEAAVFNLDILTDLSVLTLLATALFLTRRNRSIKS